MGQILEMSVDTKTEIGQKLHKKKEELNNAVEKDMPYEKILGISMELDHVINEYIRIAM